MFTFIRLEKTITWPELALQVRYAALLDLLDDSALHAVVQDPTSYDFQAQYGGTGAAGLSGVPPEDHVTDHPRPVCRHLPW